MRHSAQILAFMVSLALPASSFALGEESFGNAPKVAQPGWPEGILPVVNLKSRVYSQWVNGNENMFYRGDRDAMIEALKAFASVKDDEKRIVLLPGEGQTHSFDRKAMAFDWQLHIPSGIYRSMTKKTHPVLTIYVPAMNPKPITDRKAIDRWIQELDHNDFNVRDKANAELQTLGRDLKPILQQVLTREISAEQRSRVTNLRDSFKGYDASDLVIPSGIHVLDADDLLAGCKKDLSSPSNTLSWMAVSEMSSLSDYCPEVIAELMKLLAVEKPEYLRIAAAEKLGTMGTKAKSALTSLKTLQEDANPKIRTAMKQAYDQIDSAKETEAQTTRAKTIKTILNELEQVKKAHAGK